MGSADSFGDEGVGFLFCIPTLAVDNTIFSYTFLFTSLYYNIQLQLWCRRHCHYVLSTRLYRARFSWLWYISVLVPQHPPSATTQSLVSVTFPLRLTVFHYEGLRYIDWDKLIFIVSGYIHGFRHSYTTQVTSIQLPVNTSWSSGLISINWVFLFRGE